MEQTGKVTGEAEGESMRTALAAAASGRDPATGLRAVASLRQLVEELQELQVDNAREQGWSWERIAAALGVSKQAVHKRYAGRRFLGRGR